MTNDAALRHPTADDPAAVGRVDLAPPGAPVGGRSVIGPVAVFVVALAVLGWSWTTWQGSSATFSDVERIEGNRLGAGRLDVGVGRATAAFSATGLAAGDSASGRLEIDNTGTLPLTYTLRAATAGGPLAEVLVVRAWNGAGSCPTDVPGGAPTWDVLADGEGITTSPGTGDLAVGEARLVCLRADLPLDATSDVQGRRLDLVLGVDAVHDVAASEALADDAPDAAPDTRSDSGSSDGVSTDSDADEVTS